jgi:hypothetical protein
MLFKRVILQGIQRGEVTLAFRRWRRPTVVAGSLLHTEIGRVEIQCLEEVAPEAVTEADAHQAGFANRALLMSSLRDDPDNRLYRIQLRFAGADPRIALRETNALDAGEITQLNQRLDRLDRASAIGSWTRRTLRSIAEHPDLAAGELASRLDVEKEWLKRNVRKLKNLGLTESLQPGYRLSPRGLAFLEQNR